MFKYPAVISIIILGSSLDGSSWGAILTMTAVSIVLTAAALVEETVKSERWSRPASVKRKGRKGKGTRKIEDRRDLRSA